MSALAGQTAGPNGLKFFKENHEKWNPRLNKVSYENRFFNYFFLIPRATPDAPASLYTRQTNLDIPLENLSVGADILLESSATGLPPVIFSLLIFFLLPILDR